VTVFTSLTSQRKFTAERDSTSGAPPRPSPLRSPRTLAAWWWSPGSWWLGPSSTQRA